MIVTRIVISYSRDDLKTAEELAGFLQKAYDHVWYDLAKIRGGDEWWAKIEGAIHECNHFIFLLSEASVKSEWCIKELELAHKLEKHIIPIKIRRTVNLPDDLSYLNSIHRIEMASAVTAEASSELFATIIRSTIQENESVYQSEAHRQADLKLLDELWSLINSNCMDRMEFELNRSRLKDSFYRKTLLAYSDFRQSHPEKHFINLSLETIFLKFDEILDSLQLCVIQYWSLGIERQLDDYLISHHKLNTSEDYRQLAVAGKSYEEIQEIRRLKEGEFNETLDAFYVLKEQHFLLIKSIQQIMPEFTFPNKRIWIEEDNQ